MVTTIVPPVSSSWYRAQRIAFAFVGKADSPANQRLVVGSK